MTAIPDALDRLRYALGQLAHALEVWQADEVLASELPLAAATEALTAAMQTRSPDVESIRILASEIRMLVSRCLALGATAAQLEAAFAPAGYTARGARLRMADAKASLASRT